MSVLTDFQIDTFLHNEDSAFKRDIRPHRFDINFRRLEDKLEILERFLDYT